MFVKFRNGTSNIITLDLMTFFVRLPEGQEQMVNVPTGSEYVMETEFIERDLEMEARRYCIQNGLTHKDDFCIFVE